MNVPNDQGGTSSCGNSRVTPLNTAPPPTQLAWQSSPTTGLTPTRLAWQSSPTTGLTPTQLAWQSSPTTGLTPTPAAPISSSEDDLPPLVMEQLGNICSESITRQPSQEDNPQPEHSRSRVQKSHVVDRLPVEKDGEDDTKVMEALVRLTTQQEEMNKTIKSLAETVASVVKENVEMKKELLTFTCMIRNIDKEEVAITKTHDQQKEIIDNSRADEILNSVIHPKSIT
ncbi:hypothetical protein Pmani_031278 [Petrolisthes manimaculis]|uniref:Uncharacterized protein n=1 Tax=Petrolisthes manimaculis TaxID=1843537 RepID=A0AAE1TV20_9EUCA|nr:hypothetical protein Pmani_031278 [Petrolisthes manimaculis]